MTKPASMSLAQLDARKAGETPFEFEYVLPNGSGSGVFLSVLGEQCEKVSDEINRLVNERRRREQMAAVQASNSRPGQAPVASVESDIEFAQKLAAVRLVGWRGIEEPFTPENGLQLVKSNADAMQQIIDASKSVTNFLRV